MKLFGSNTNSGMIWKSSDWFGINFNLKLSPGGLKFEVWRILRKKTSRIRRNIGESFRLKFILLDQSEFFRHFILIYLIRKEFPILFNPWPPIQMNPKSIRRIYSIRVSYPNKTEHTFRSLCVIRMNSKPNRTHISIRTVNLNESEPQPARLFYPFQSEVFSNFNPIESDTKPDESDIYLNKLSFLLNPFRTTISIRINSKSNPNTRFIRDPNPNDFQTFPIPDFNTNDNQ